MFHGDFVMLEFRGILRFFKKAQFYLRYINFIVRLCWLLLAYPWN